MPQSIHPIIYTLIVNGRVNLWEVDEKYDIWGILQLYDITVCSIINKHRSIEDMKER